MERGFPGLIRKIPIADLLPGMYVVDLHKSWIEHALWRRRFLVRDAAHVELIKASSITEVSIDTGKGIDVPAPVDETSNMLERSLRSLSKKPRHVVHREAPQVSLGEERRRATGLIFEASTTIRHLMHAARVGHSVDAGRLEPVVSKMIQSIMRNPDALVPLARIKKQDAYASDHAVATAALIVALGQQQHLPEHELEKLALGTMLKDVGQAAIDAKLIGKRGALSQDEKSVMQSHVEEGLAVLDATSRLPETAVAVILEHHERFDGSGYPFRRVGDDISSAGRMAAIVDTYDAMTSHRPYRQAMAPSLVLNQLVAEGTNHYDPQLVASFVQAIGPFPVGSLVLLESGHLAVVDEVNHQDWLAPVVRVIYHTGRRQYVTPVRVDLSRKFGNHYGFIVRAEQYETWGLSPLRWEPV